MTLPGTYEGEGYGSAIYAYGKYNYDYESKENGDGTFTESDSSEAGKIIIENSNVEASGSKFAMVADAGYVWSETYSRDPYTVISSSKQITSNGSIELINSTITSPEGAKVYVNDVVGDEYEGCAYIVDAEGKIVKEVVIKKAESTASHRAAVNTGLNTDISLYVAAGLAAIAGAEVLNSLKKKH